MPSLFVGIPHTRPFEGEFLDSLMGSNHPLETTIMRLPGRAVDDARNLLVKNFLNYPTYHDYLLMVDSDATWHPDAIPRLLSHALPIVTACIYYRGLPPVPTFGPYAGQNSEGHHAYHFGKAADEIFNYCEKAGVKADTQNAVCLPPRAKDLWRIDGTGMHFCLIRRDVLEKMKPPWFYQVKGENGGEDFHFCRQAIAAGYTLHADLAVHTGHIVGPGFDFGLREFLVYYRMNQLNPRKEIWDVGGLAAPVRLP